MKVTDKTVSLISDLEYIVGNACYNPDSYNGWTGEYGKSYRYPVWYITEFDDGDTYEDKTKYRLSNQSAKRVSGAFYKFGANHLCIGQALQRLLTHLEERYDIDFEELEETFKVGVSQKLGQTKSEKREQYIVTMIAVLPGP